jgi:subtilase family serine protease
LVLAASLVASVSMTACGGGGTGSSAPLNLPQSSQVAPAAAAPVSPLTAIDATQTSFRAELAAGRVIPACGVPVFPDQNQCNSYILTDTGRQALGMRQSSAAAAPSGYGPADLQSAYKLTTSGGAGRLVGIVDAYNAKTLAADLAVYRSQYDLPACTVANGCLTIVSQTGSTTALPKNNASWEEETSLDTDMVSANCPNCRILVVETNSASNADLEAGEKEAAKRGAVSISNSYGGSESSTETATASDYSYAGVAVTASNGDSGYGVESPASYNTVTAVGGTTLTKASNARGWTETVWDGSGSGCSAYIAKPSWQKDASCKNRMVGDVAYVGDPNSGVAVYDSTPYQGYSGWLVFGGTSVGSPAIAAIYALAGNGLSTAAHAYANTGSLNDVTGGSNGRCSVAYYCTGELGYDGPTGNGTPNGTGAF